MQLPIITAAILWVSGTTAAVADDLDVMEFLSDRHDTTASIARTLWEYAEVGYKETRSARLLADTLAAEGFDVEMGVAGLPTAFTASWGSGGPVIAILAEYDALPGINQDSVGHRHQIEGKGAGHACGHNLFGSGSVSAAIAVRKWLEESGTTGTVRLYGSPAEEGGSGKVYMVREGLFDDVDIAIHWHAATVNRVMSSATLANRAGKFRFYGVSAHAAAAPHNGRSALDGVEAMNHMVNMMREHVPQETRIHYVISSGGQAPNVVPDFAEVYYYVRHPDSRVVDDVWARLLVAADGAAMGTETRVENEVLSGVHGRLINRTLARAAQKHLEAVGGIPYNKEERAFAEAIYETFRSPSASLESAAEVQKLEFRPAGGGSTDVGDVSIAIPTVGVNTATYVPGTSGHSWQAVASSGMSIGFQGATNAAKAMTLIAIELYQSPDLIDAAKQEHAENLGPDFEYKAMLGDRNPPLNYRD